MATLDERPMAPDSIAQTPNAQATDVTPDTPAAGTIERLADDLLPALIARLDASDLSELEVRTDAWRVRLRKPFDRRRPVLLPEGRRRRPDATDVARSRPHEQGQTAGSHAGHASPSALRSSGGHAGPAAAEDGADRDGLTAVPPPAVATSPAVGYFSPRDGWTTGHRVRSGDVLGWVDCLGVRQDVVAPVDGHVGRLLAQPGEAVEYGQPLVHVDLPRPVAQPSAAEALVARPPAPEASAAQPAAAQPAAAQPAAATPPSPESA